jgi:hypothetical protein
MDYIANDAATQPPEDLRRRNQWLPYKLKRKPDGDLDKVPTDPDAGTPEDRNSFNLTYDQARSAVEGSRHVHGVGFNLTDRDPLACIDLDKCRNPETGKIEEWALKIVRLLDSYAEVSVSGTGVHIFAYGVVVEKTRPEVLGHSIETYSRDRFIAVMGKHLEGTPAEVRDAQHVLNAIARDNPKTPDAAPTVGPGNRLDDDAVLARARNGRKGRDGEEFIRLYDLELPSIGWQLFILGCSQGDSSAFPSRLATYTTRLLTEPLRVGLLQMAHLPSSRYTAVRSSNVAIQVFYATFANLTYPCHA